jgi:hypothetical protein
VINLHYFFVVCCILAAIDFILPVPPVNVGFPWWRWLPGSEIVLWLMYWKNNK